ncbi:MAG: diguanylate cyclase, partial [Leptospiraceae bacterium]|nr:diguanylate cyclase [Leptospiraceae bacterium]
FMILLRNELAKEYRTVAENLRSGIEKLSVEWDPEPIRFTISIGATVLREGEKLADFYARADKLLYQAKESGRNRVCFESLPISPNPKPA